MHKQKAGIGTWFGKRFWEYRQFYSAYIALFIAISNWITIQYRLVLENIPILNSLFSNIVIFLIVAVVLISIISVLGGHYIHRKRQFRIEQELATEENPYLYRAAPGKEKDLMIPIYILQLETLEDLLRQNNSLTNEKKMQFQNFKTELLKLAQGRSIGTFK
ncbi:MAG TPA: hypothetical protein VFK40_13055 [Nitrososphaeraceae archaeon]|nr:hypothetical protein [Nitrososphaeraceae archaeon]